MLLMRLLECIASLLSQTLPPSQFTVPPRPPHVQPAWEKLPTLTPLQSNSFTQRQLETYFQVQHHLHCPPLSHSHHSIHPHPLSPHPHTLPHIPSHPPLTYPHTLPLHPSHSPLTYPLTSLTPSPHIPSHPHTQVHKEMDTLQLDQTQSTLAPPPSPSSGSPDVTRRIKGEEGEATPEQAEGKVGHTRCCS